MTDAFADAFALLAAAADAPGCKSRLVELKKQLDAVEKARTQLEADRAAVAADKAASGEREKTLREREAKVVLAERILSKGQEELAAARRALAPGYQDPNLFGTITREAYSE
jgi:hypothetical protein